MEKTYIPIEMADISLVEIKTTNECEPTPHCKVHGAMNKMKMAEVIDDASVLLDLCV